MRKGVLWLVLAAVAVYVLLRPQRGKVGSTMLPTAKPATPGVGTQVGQIVDGLYTLGKGLFTSSPQEPSIPTAESLGLATAPGERADFV